MSMAAHNSNTDGRSQPAARAQRGALIAIVQAHMDRYGVSEAEVARRIGTSPATVNTWRNGQLRQLPHREYLEGLADLSGIYYLEVLMAALIDTGYINRDHVQTLPSALIDNRQRQNTKIHELKTWPMHWQAVKGGFKTLELRKADRDFGLGDILLLREWDPDTKRYSGRECRRQVSHILRGDGVFGLAEGHVAMSLALVLE